jgi:hypothetical protein
MTTNDNILSRELEAEKTADGKESLTMTIKAPTLGGGEEGQAQTKIAEEMARQLGAP